MNQFVHSNITTINSSFALTVPQTLLREADPYVFSTTSSPTAATEKGNITCMSVYTLNFFVVLFNIMNFVILSKVPPKDLREPFPKGSRRPENSGAMMSNSLLTYAYIRGKCPPHVCIRKCTPYTCLYMSSLFLP